MTHVRHAFKGVGNRGFDSETAMFYALLIPNTIDYCVVVRSHDGDETGLTCSLDIAGEQASYIQSCRSNFAEGAYRRPQCGAGLLPTS